MKPIATLILLSGFATTLFAADASTRIEQRIEQRIEERLADRFGLRGGISTYSGVGRHGGVASIVDVRRGVSYEVRVGDRLPSSPRFRLARIERTYAVLESRQYRIKIRRMDGEFRSWSPGKQTTASYERGPSESVDPMTSAEKLKDKTIALCRSDARQLCDPSEKDPNETLTCLLLNSDRVSESCADVLYHSSSLDFDRR